MNPTTNAISQAESKWIEEQISSASRFVSKFASGQPLTLRTLEAAWDAWMASNPTDTEEINSIVNAVGCAFGQALVDSTSFNWVIAEDSNGTDLAILAEPGKGDYLVFPANLISKRWVARESGFIWALANTLVAKIGGDSASMAEKKVLVAVVVTGGLTLSSTRTPPALSGFLSLFPSFSASFGASPQAGPVSLNR